MIRVKPKSYQQQSFDNLHGLAGISDEQLAEHLKLYAGHVTHVNLLNEELAESRAREKTTLMSPAMAELTLRLGFECNGMILHGSRSA